MSALALKMESTETIGLVADTSGIHKENGDHLAETPILKTNCKRSFDSTLLINGEKQ